LRASSVRAPPPPAPSPTLLPYTSLFRSFAQRATLPLALLPLWPHLCFCAVFNHHSRAVLPRANGGPLCAGRFHCHLHWLIYFYCHLARPQHGKRHQICCLPIYAFSKYQLILCCCFNIYTKRS